MRASLIQGTRRIAQNFHRRLIGPTTKTASISPDVNNPAYRATSFDEAHENVSKEQTIAALMKAARIYFCPKRISIH
ncbi:MAG: hypothetical protein U1F16_05265 [Turneriella sp.]